jgi:hypothetical protein
MTTEYRMTKKITILLIALLASLQFAYSLSLRERILNLPGIISVDSMEHNQFFQESWIIMIRQSLDHRHPELGTFPQRVILSHLGYDEPVVMITEGYSAGKETGPDYLNELCPLLYANQLFIEHRYFGKSVPDPVNWKYLTVENAAADHHHIAEIFKQLYPARWISTGISKGGQASLLHRMLYPGDVALTVAYVAPLNFAVEDKRHDLFIRHRVDTLPDRRKVFSFQKELLKRKPSLLPLFEKYCDEKKYHFNTPVGEIYDYCVLEFAFSFWQWCRSIDDIPPPGSPDNALIRYFTEIISPGYFDTVSGREVLPFFVQALRQLGYYAYNTRPFRGLMQLRDTKGYVARLFVPEEAQFPWDPSISARLRKFMRKDAKNILLIYGANDPWSASSVNPGRNRSVLKIVQAGGCHVSRINTLPEEQNDLAVSTLTRWLKEN